MAFGGVKEGLKMGVKISAWVTAFFWIEDCWDEVRDQKDFLNTVVASLTVAGGFSLWSKFFINGLESSRYIADLFCRSVPSDGGCEDGKDGIGFWACVWPCTGCGGCDERETAGLCRLCVEGREAESGLYANRGHIRIELHHTQLIWSMVFEGAIEIQVNLVLPMCMSSLIIGTYGTSPFAQQPLISFMNTQFWRRIVIT